MSVPVVSLVGKSGVGKTTLLEKLLPELARRGHRVGTLKHDAHDFEMDHPGKDSYRHFHAGSIAAGIASACKLGIVKRLDAPRGVFELATAYFHDVDLLLTEGFKRDTAPKIEVSRKALGKRLLCDRGRDRLAAVVADHVPRGLGRVPVFTPDDVAGLADFLERRFMKKCGPASSRFSVRLVVDKKKIPLKAFVQEFIAGSIQGMIGALKGVKSAKSITVSIKRKGGQ